MTAASLSPDWPCAQGYVWFTRRRGSKIDTRVLATGPPYEANMGTSLNTKSIEYRDLVVWYGAHVGHEGLPTGGHVTTQVAGVPGNSTEIWPRPEPVDLSVGEVPAWTTPTTVEHPAGES